VPRINRRWLHSGHRPLKTAALVCAVAIPALAGCEAGANAPALQFHPAANGAATVAAGGITINDAFVLGPAPNQTLPAGGQAGVFLSITSANADQLESVSADKAASVRLTGGPINVPAAADGAVNLTGPVPRIILTGLNTPLMGGQTVAVTFHFANAGDISLDLPIEPHAYEYATLAPPPKPTPTATASPSTSASTKAGKKSAKKSGAHASATGSASPGSSASPSPTP